MVDMGSRARVERHRFAMQVFAATDQAMADRAVEVRHVNVAGVAVQLEFTNPAMSAQVMPALCHIEEDARAVLNPEVRLRIWDSNSTGVAVPSVRLPRGAFADRGDLPGFGSDRILVSFHFAEPAVCIFDRDAGRGVYWVNDAANVPAWTRASPLRTLLHWALMDRGRHLVHGAAVGDTHAGVLLVGPGGSGKSTTALRCLAAGMTYLGDDYVAVAADPPRAYSIYSTAKLLRTGPRIAGRPLGPPAPGDEKVVLALGDHGTQLIREIPLRAVIALGFGDRPESALETVDPAALLYAATATSLEQLPHAGAPLRRLMGEVMPRVSTMRLRLGRNPDSVVSAVRAIVAGRRLAVVPVEADVLPLVSIVIPVHHGVSFLTQAIASVLDQKYPALEFIVVEDGSTDDIDAAVAQLPVGVTLVRQSRQGLASARNTGIGAARGKLLMFLDVDDLLPPGSLEQLVRAAIEKDVDVVTGFAQQASGSDEVPPPFPYSAGGTLYRRAVFDSVGLFDPDMPYAQDVDWFNRFHESGRKVQRVFLTTLIVRQSPPNTTHHQHIVSSQILGVLKSSLDRRRARQGPDVNADQSE